MQTIVVILVAFPPRTRPENTKFLHSHQARHALTDISQIIPKFREIVPPFHRQENWLPWYSRFMRWPVILAVLLMASPALADITGPARVIDGDTIDVAGERIRFHGIDAPESGQTCIAGGVTWPCGQRATAALVEFIGDSPVRCEGQGTDRYGRTIAACTVRGEDIEAWMVLNGWALAYLYP